MSNGVLDPERQGMLTDAMASRGIKALLAWFPEDALMMSGCHTCLGMNICLYPSTGTPIVYAPLNEPPDAIPAGFDQRRYALPANREPGAWAELENMIREDIERLSIDFKQLGVARDDGQHALPFAVAETPILTTRTMETMLPEIRSCETTAIFTELGLRKTRREVAAIRRTNAAAAAGLRAFYAALEPGRTEAQVASRVEAAIQDESGKWGCRHARGWAFVQAGTNSLLGATYSRSSAKKLIKGELVLLELGACVDGYWCDLTRTGCVGLPGERERDLLQAVKDAKAAAIAAIRPGVSYEQVDAAAHGVLDERGCGATFTHSCGHHVGFRYHDRGPSLLRGNILPLQQGMVLAVEPGVYEQSIGGAVRFEDNVLVGAQGAEVLSPIEITDP